MKMTLCNAAVIAAAGVTMLSAVSSCVDHDYDLTGEIDKNINFGGDLTLPASSTDELRLSKILDLESGSSIKEAEYDGQYGEGIVKGDYVLVQDGERSDYDFSIPVVEIKDMGNNESRPTELPPFFNAGTGDRVTVDMTNPTVNEINLSDDDVTTEILSLQSAETNIDIIFHVGYNVSTSSDIDFRGTCYIEQGYVATFSEAWTLEIADAATASFLEVFDGHKVRFTRSVAIEHGKGFSAHVRIVSVDFADLPDDQGLYEPGHFRMNTTIESLGSVSIMASEFPAMSTVKLDLVTRTEVVNATLNSVTGTFDPVINVDDTRFDICDIPDFLQGDNNSLDIENPRFYLSVTNNSPLAITLSAKLEAFKNGNAEAEATVRIGAPATDVIELAPLATTRICLSQKAVTENGVQNVVVDNLSSLISTIPDYVAVSDIDVKAVRETVTLTLGENRRYTFSNDYDVIVPLAFGANLRFVYDDTERDWNTELDKYNFNEVHVSLTAMSTIPLTLTPSVEALDRMGNVMPNVTAEVEGTVGGGSLATPSPSNLKIIIKSTGENLDGLDGIRYEFTAVSDPNAVGVALNANQSLRFEDIRLSIVGGVTIDLNKFEDDNKDNNDDDRDDDDN